jgi:hypothetical protein
MSGDYSRITFDPWHDDLGVLLQQGRPLTDADWNALVQQLRRRVHVGTLDTFGPATVPMQTPEGFKIVPNGTGGLAIKPGRLYADGLQAENHGGGPLVWEPRLEELVGAESIDYTKQPYYPNPDPLPKTPGPHVVYLDVWQREITHLVRRELVDTAVGVDTCTRLQTVWQVKVVADVDDADCSTPLDFPPSGGRLSTATAVIPGEPDPCLVPVPSGYNGKENQCYRFQIHLGGPLGVATGKWSRDSASVGARVTHILASNQIVVDSLGRDSVLRLSPGDFVEVLDDWLELHNLPGEIRRITAVDDPTRTITLETALTVSLFPTDPATHETQPARHTRVQRWDQGGIIRDENGNELQNLDQAASPGTITIPTGGLGVLLEHNIVAKFSIAPEAGEFHSGDHWVFSARTIDGLIDEFQNAPPLGTHHHYAKLAIVTLPDAIEDCRQLCDPCAGETVPPTETGAAEHCACTVCVTPAQHASGQLTIQMAINQVVTAQPQGGTVCLEVGTYSIAAPLSIAGARSLRLVGKGIESKLEGDGRILGIQDSTDVALESFAMISGAAAQTPDGVLSIRSSDQIAVERLAIHIEGQVQTWSAVQLTGALTDIRFRENTLSGFVGIRNFPTGAQTTLTDLRIDDNLFDCSEIGVQLTSGTAHKRMTRLRGNRVIGCRQAGFILTGSGILPSLGSDSGVDIAGNVLKVEGNGIEASVDRLRLCENDIQAAAPAADQNGVVLRASTIPTANPNGPEATQIMSNRIVGFQGAGILVQVPRLRAMEIKHNQIEDVGAGVVLDVQGLMHQLGIENNQMSGIRGFGIRAEADHGRILTAANHIETVGNPPVRVFFRNGENVFTDNQCRGGGPNASDVVLGGDTVIVTSNRVHGSTPTSTSLEIHVTERQYTLLGNIVHGTIKVNGQDPDSKWEPLNLQSI